MALLDQTIAPEDVDIPPDIAAAAVLPKSYREEKVFYDAFAWLRKNQPLGLAKLPGYDPAWLVTKHADVMLIERQAVLIQEHGG